MLKLLVLCIRFEVLTVVMVHVFWVYVMWRGIQLAMFWKNKLPLSSGQLKMATVLCSTKSLATANQITSYAARLQQFGSP
jgi:hypothetical protein